MMSRYMASLIDRLFAIMISSLLFVSLLAGCAVYQSSDREWFNSNASAAKNTTQSEASSKPMTVDGFTCAPTTDLAALANLGITFTDSDRAEHITELPLLTHLSLAKLISPEQAVVCETMIARTTDAAMTDLDPVRLRGEIVLETMSLRFAQR